MRAPTIDAAERARREQKAWDEDLVWEKCNGWIGRVIHVVEGPNSARGERKFDAILAAAARGGKVLDVGCGLGQATLDLLAHRPERVLGIDVSRSMVDAARAAAAGRSENVEFRLQSTEEPLLDRFDLIFGRAILHHIDFREFLRRAYGENLRPGGRMAFFEPMSNPLTVAFHRLVRSAHTPDERPIGRSDVAWLRRSFPRVTLHGINLLSFPAGILSTFAFASPDNWLMRGADAADCRALAMMPGLATYARQAIIVIDKPA